MATQAQAQTVFDERGLSDLLEFPQWTTPTPACYSKNSEQHFSVKIGNCTGDDRCSGDEEKY